MDMWGILADVVVLLASCLLAGSIASRIGQSPLVGYLLAGMLLGGPGSIGLVRSQSEIEAIAELGVALLLFSLGLEFSIARLRELGSRPLVAGVIQVTLTVAIAAALALPFGLSIKSALALGAMVSLSSTAVVLRILMERSELEAPHGRNSLGVLLTQDMAVVPLAILMTLLGGNGTSTEIALDVAKLVLMAALLSAALYLLTRVAVLALGSLTLHSNRELAVLLAAAMGLGSAWAAHKVGVSPALGAFAAGMLLGSSSFATQIRADVSPLRILLLTLFFGAAGMVADPIWILMNWYVVASVAIVLTLGKLLIIAFIFRRLGQSWRVAAASGLCLAQVGEFAFVLGSVGRDYGVVSEDLYALVVSVTIVSFFLSAFLVPLAPRFGNWIAGLGRAANREPQAEASRKAPCDAIVIGFGPAGQLAALPLIDTKFRVGVLDLNQQGVQQAISLGFDGQVGDATQSEVLEHAHIQDARLVVIAVPHHSAALSILQLIRARNPNAEIIVRSRYERHVPDLMSLGVQVVGDEHQVGLAMAGQIRNWLDHLN